MLRTVLVLASLIVQTAPAATRSLVIVIDRTHAGLVYQCNGRRMEEPDIQKTVAEELKRVGSVDTPTSVLIAEDAPVVTAFEMSAVLGNTIGLRNVRYFVFSRKTNVMIEITLGGERWRLSFEGKLVKSNR